jgi:oligoribonuclease NrnB/cAMP/cGMP phosphodiesterase (DHH superfamily)
MKTLVIYHAGCFDGWCSAWLFHMAFPEAEFHAAHYGTKLPDVCGKQVFIVDFSYPRDVIMQIIGQAHAVCVLDHHVTARDNLANLPSCTQAVFASGEGRIHITFDMEKSGGRLAWEYLAENRLLPDHMMGPNAIGYSFIVAPWLVDYTEDRDLWRHILPRSREVNASLRSYPLDFNTWDALAVRKPTELANEGQAILRYQDTVVADHVRNAVEVDLDDHKVLAVNATTMMSEIGNELSKDRPFSITYFQRKDGRYEYSLRSRDGGADVSEIAKRHGGGGHVRASGYDSEMSPIG